MIGSQSSPGESDCGRPEGYRSRLLMEEAPPLSSRVLQRGGGSGGTDGKD